MNSEAYIRANQDRLTDYAFVHVRNPSVEFLHEFKDRIMWSKLCEYAMLNDEVQNEFIDCLDMNHLVFGSNVSEKLIEKRIKDVELALVFTYQYGYSAKFVSKYATTESMILNAFKSHHVSVEFIEEHKALLKPGDLSRNPYITYEIICKYKDILDMECANVRSIYDAAEQFTKAGICKRFEFVRESVCKFL